MSEGSYSDRFSSYIKKVEARLETIASQFGESDDLALAISYSLRSGGKRLRPVITLMVAEALGQNQVLDAAIALELFHTASLLADDLPCMDDAQERRGQVATHRAFNEATSLLASYALIAKGYQLINENACIFEKEQHIQVLHLALQNASESTGYWGASGGQYLDLYSKDVNAAVIDEVMRKKTGALFETAFLFGWLFGGHLLECSAVKQLGMDFGFAFQLIDDLLDYEEDLSQKRKINHALYFGIEATTQCVRTLLHRCEQGLHTLGLATEPLLGLVYMMRQRIENTTSLAQRA
jgi:geranylgeranyl diphosphate synthase type II